ncbi:MAG: hypothetical protein U5R31_04160 [Acidimicrobiia bacterium]|nr:hypothetical protein [Acidimicrobiia bacterium]
MRRPFWPSTRHDDVVGQRRDDLVLCLHEQRVAHQEDAPGMPPAPPIVRRIPVDPGSALGELEDSGGSRRCRRVAGTNGRGRGAAGGRAVADREEEDEQRDEGGAPGGPVASS